MSPRNYYHKYINKLYYKIYNTTNNEILSKRLIQKIILIFNINKIDVIDTTRIPNKELIVKEFNKDGVKFDIKSFEIKISLYGFIRYYLKFIYYFLYYFISILFTIFTKKIKDRKINLFFLGKRRIKIFEFYKKINSFKDNYPISKNSIFIVDYKKNFFFKKNIFFAKDPLVKLFSLTQNINCKIFFIFYFVILFFRMTINFINKPIYLLISKDFLEREIIQYLNSKNLVINIFCNISKLTDTPLWFKNKKKKLNTFFIWSSVDPLLGYYFNHRDKKLASIWVNYINADKHYFYSNIFKQFKHRIEKFIDKKKIEIIKIKKKSYKKINFKNKKLLIFDVNPDKDVYFNGKKYEAYCSLNNLKKFINNTLQVISNINVSKKKKIMVYLKPKKGILRSTISEEYKNFLRKKKIKVLNGNYNFESNINKYFFIILYPFTTVPFDFPHELKKKFIYYDISGNLINNSKLLKVELFSSMNKIKKKIIKIK